MVNKVLWVKTEEKLLWSMDSL